LTSTGTEIGALLVSVPVVPVVFEKKSRVVDAELDIPHSVLIEGQRIAFSQTGKGCRVALLHGIPTSRLLWRHVVPLLAERGCEVTAIDLLG
jgi:pimeloyl-ACP methyl ester carboxylesterase